MKSMTLTLLAGLIGASASCAALAMDESACRGGYATMLLTQNECRNWVDTRAGLEKRGQLNELKQLDEKMRGLMAERAEVCPCSWDHALRQQMLKRNAGL
jgi:hypothetical protein